VRILIIDPQFEDVPDVEADVAGSEATFDVLRFGAGPMSAEAGRNADAVVNFRSRRPLSAADVNLMDKVKIVVQAGVGFNHIDVESCARRGIPVCNTPDYGTREVADHAIALTLALTRGITAYNNRLLVREASWDTSSLSLPPVRRLAGQVFGIVGLGRIGTGVALRALALQTVVAFYDPHLPAGHELALGLKRYETLDELLAASDVVSLHCPLTEATTGMIGHAAVAAMKLGAVLINTARGGVVNLDAVESGLRTGKISAAGLDVLPVEPLDRAHPLLASWLAQEGWLDGRLVLTPHAAFYTPESLADMRRLSTQTAVNFVRDGKLRSCVNMAELARHGYFLNA